MRGCEDGNIITAQRYRARYTGGDMIAEIELESKMNEIRKRLAELDGVTGDGVAIKKSARKDEERKNSSDRADGE